MSTSSLEVSGFVPTCARPEVAQGSKALEKKESTAKKEREEERKGNISSHAYKLVGPWPN